MTDTTFVRGAVLGLLVASVGWLTVAGCTTVSPDGAEPTAVELSEAVHFTAHDGSDVLVEPGLYRVSEAEGGLRLTSEGDGGETLLGADASVYAEALAAPAAQLESEGEDARSIVLFLPDGTSLAAAGSRSGIRARGKTRTSRTRRPTSRTRRSVARVVARPSEGATGGPSAAAGQWHPCACEDGTTYECMSRSGDGRGCCERAAPALCGGGRPSTETVDVKLFGDVLTLNATPTGVVDVDRSRRERHFEGAYHECECEDGSAYSCMSTRGDGAECCVRTMPVLCDESG